MAPHLVHGWLPEQYEQFRLTAEANRIAAWNAVATTAVAALAAAVAVWAKLSEGTDEQRARSARLRAASVGVRHSFALALRAIEIVESADSAQTLRVRALLNMLEPGELVVSQIIARGVEDEDLFTSAVNLQTAFSTITRNLHEMLMANPSHPELAKYGIGGGRLRRTPTVAEWLAEYKEMIEDLRREAREADERHLRL